MPDYKAPNTKYLIPDSADFIESRCIAAKTYKDKLCNSIPKYIAIKLLELIRTIIPKVANSIKIGISNLDNLSSLKKLIEIIMLAILPYITKSLKKIINFEFLKKTSYEAKNIFVSLITMKLTKSNNKIESNEIFSNIFFLRKRAIIKIIRDPIVKINSAK